MKEEPPEGPPPPRRRLGWLRREGIDLGDAAVQFVAVLLGVLFALLISQWNDHRQQQAKARAATRQQQATVDEAMRAIRAELTANRFQLHYSVTHLYTMAERVQHAPANQKQPPRSCYLWDQWAGNGTFLNLTDSAYQTAIATQAMAHMPFQQAQKVAEVYGGQRVLENGLNLLRSNVLFSGPQKLTVCTRTLEGIGLSERMVDDAYTLLIGPDKTKWPAPPLPLPGLTTK